MPLTLPGVLGRVFTNLTDKFQSSKHAGESFPSFYVDGGGRVYISDGSEDLTSGSLNYLQPTMYLRARPASTGLTIRGNSDATARNIIEVTDHAGAGIFAIGNIGGMFLNDLLRVAFAAFGPVNILGDIYGNLQLGNQSAIRCAAGPPGNAMFFVDSTGEIFEQTRGPSQGTWTATNATYSAKDYGAGFAPSGMRYARAWTSAAAGTVTAITATGTAGYPCTSNVFVAASIVTQAATVGRAKTLSLLFYNASGTQVGSTVSGTAVTDNTTGFTTLTVQAVSPPGARFMALQLSIAGVAAANEVHYDTMAGIWPGLVTSQVTAWNPPFVFRQNGFLPAAVGVTGCTGNGVSPIVVSVPTGHPFKVGDSVTTTAIGGNTNANQTNAVISAITSTSFTIPGTGNANYTTGGSAQLTNSALGYYDGANAGDVFIRSDGPANVVQRFWTNAAAGRPWQQNWTSDPRITSQPARLNWYGGSYLVQGATNNPDYVLPSVAAGMLHNDANDSVNRGVAGAVLLDGSGNNSILVGGSNAFLSYVRKKNTGAPYASKDGLFAFMYGLWDLATVSSGGGAASMSKMNGPGTANNNGSIVHTLRDLITRARASNVLEETNAAFVLTGGVASGLGFYYASGGTPGALGAQGGSFQSFNSTTSNLFTFTIPADFNGSEIGISFIGDAGGFGGTVTWTGTLFSTGGITNPGTTQISNTTDAGYRGRVCVRFTGLSSVNAGQTIIGTITQLDTSGSVNLDCAYLVGENPNAVAVCGMPRLVNNAAYAALALAGSYWNGNSGSTGDTDVAALNTSLQALVAQFGPEVFYVDIDSAMQKQAQYFAANGFNIDELGVHAMAGVFVQAVQTMLPLVNFRSVNHDYHDFTPFPIGTYTVQGQVAPFAGVSRITVDDYWQITSVRATVGTAPTGQSLIVDVLKNGTTVFSANPANRATIAAGANTAVSAVPDVTMLVPGDYLTISVPQAGSSFGGSDLTVTVTGRKVPRV